MHSYYTYRYKQEGSDFEQQVTVAQKFEFSQPCNKAAKGFTSFMLQNSKAFAYYEEKVKILRLVSTNNIFLPFGKYYNQYKIAYTYNKYIHIIDTQFLPT